MMKPRHFVLFVLIPAALSFAGCADYYAGYPGYGPYYGPGPYYGGGSVTVAVGDRPYYRGPGYWYGGGYYVWKPGHWGWRHANTFGSAGTTWSADTDRANSNYSTG